MMKKYLILFFMVFVLISCDDNNIMQGEDIDVSSEIKQNELWKYDLGGYPIEGGFSIVQNPNHATISEIKFDSTDYGLFYWYQPKEEYIGKDKIVIERGSSIGDSNISFQYINIELSISK